MTKPEEAQHHRKHHRYDVSLTGMLVTTDASVSVQILNLSLGGAMVRLYMLGHNSFGDHVKVLNIEELGAIPCKVVMKRDLIFHLQFTNPASKGSRLGTFLTKLREPFLEATPEASTNLGAPHLT